jgi:ribosome-associated heat shock protein Hsp15
LLRSARNDDEVRIDRYLHCIRLVRSRTLAQAVIETGPVRIDGKRIEKVSEDVRVGSVIALPLHGKVRVLRVLALPDRRGPAAEARLAYEEIEADG